MPREAYISAYGLGELKGWCRAQDLFSRFAVGRPLDGELVFYASLFQAGVDRLIVVDGEIDSVVMQKGYQVPERRRKTVQFPQLESIQKAVQSYFEEHLGKEWWRRKETRPGLDLYCDLVQLITSFRLKKP